MLNNNVNDSASKSTLNDLKKKVDTLMQTVAGYSSMISSEKGKFDEVEANKVKTPILEGTEVNASNVTAKSVKTDVLQAGTTSLGHTVVESLKVLGNKGVTADIDEATINEAEINDLRVKNSLTLDNPVMNRLELTDDVSALEGNFTRVNVKSVDTFMKALDSELKSVLNIGEGFKDIRLDTENRPTWSGKGIALLADVSGLTFIGVFDKVPETGNKGEVAYINGGKIAVYDEGWTVDELPILAAYRTSVEQDAIDYNLQNQIGEISTDIDTKVSRVQKNVDDLVDRVSEDETNNEAVHNAIEERLTSDEETTKDVSDRVEVIEGDYVKNAPSDTVLYGMKDGNWVSVNDNSAFVPKEFKDDEGNIVNKIKSDENGISIDSEKDIIVKTAEEKDETTKQVVNVEYIRNNLSLAKQSGKIEEKQIRYKPMTMVGKHHVSSNVERFVGGYAHNTNIYGSDGFMPTVDTTVKLRDYVVTWDSSGSHASAAGLQFMDVTVFDKEGNEYDIDSREFTGLMYHPTYQNLVTIGHFHKDIYEKYPQFANYWYLMSESLDKIEVFDGYKSIGVIDTGTQWTTDYYNTNEYGQLWAVPLEGRPAILIFRNLSQVGYIIGYNEDDEVDPMAIKRITLPGWPMANRVYGGKDYWWGLNQLAGSKNLVMRIGHDGTSVANIAQNSKGELVDATETYDNTLGGSVLENGDVIFGINTKVNTVDGKASAYTTGFIYCYNETDALIPFDFITTSVLWAEDGTTYDYMPKSFRAFFEAGNYIYFIPSVAYPVYQSSTTNIAHATTTLSTMKLACINQYAVINKTSKAVTYAVYPWAQTAATYQELRWVRTKDDYVWILPPHNLMIDKCLVISPTGQAQSIDFETGSNYNWSAGVVMCKWSGDSRYPNMCWSNRVAVNEDGIGCVIDRTGSAIAIFYGNGNKAVFEFGEPGTPTAATVEKKLVFAPGQITRDYWGGAYNYNMGVGIISVGKSFLICNGYDDYIMYTEITPSENPLEMPTIRYLEPYYPGTTAYRLCYTPSFWDFYDGQFDYRAQARLNNNVVPVSFHTGSQWGCFIEKSIAEENESIYLKDGDYVISNT